MNLQEAIDAPAWHSEHFPASFWPREARPGVLVVEGRLSADTIKELRRRGHKVEVAADWSEGRLTAASRGQNDAGKCSECQAGASIASCRFIFACTWRRKNCAVHW